ncbi:MAG: CCA tRNA nucleotidyltransferase [Clostridia bacterium]|nr:CCA tRNA nucleotidyltransferase [Clostridia bacterium]
MNIPANAKYILEKLQNAGFEAYLVGGCVRDFLLEKEPSDFDITTNAKPDETIAVFSANRTVPTGLKHGTVTVIYNGEPFEITTYRTETTYTDGRHPDSVAFSENIADDLCRRDFTVNAMAMSLDGKIVDLYGGRADLEKGLIRAVGEPCVRFTEDALRILRAFRFASKLGFEIEERTLAAAGELAGRLQLVSRERISDELQKLLCGKAAGKTLAKMYEKCIFEHTFENPVINDNVFSFIDTLPLTADVRLSALLLNDECFEEHIRSLKPSTQLLESVSGIITAHLPASYDKPTLRRAIYAYGYGALVKRAEIERKSTLVAALKALIESENCFKISDLAISGDDIIKNTNLSGRAVGEKLAEVLFAVLDEKIPNTYDAEITLIKVDNR